MGAVLRLTIYTIGICTSIFCMQTGICTQVKGGVIVFFCSIGYFIEAANITLRLRILDMLRRTARLRARLEEEEGEDEE